MCRHEKGSSIYEVVAVFMSSYIVSWLILEDLVFAEINLLGWSYISGSLLILIFFAIMLIAKRNFSTYGLTLMSWKQGLGVGLNCYLIRLLPLGALLLMHLNGYTYTTPEASMVISLGQVAAISVFLTLYGRKPLVDKRKTGIDLAIILTLLMLPIIVGYALDRLSVQVVSTVVWQFIFSGFGEEILYRGYYQSRVNEEFGRPWSTMGVNFGPGLLVSSILFALSHALNTFNPFRGRYTLSWGWALFTFFGGLFFGLIREKTGSVVASGVAHGLPDAVGEAFAKVMRLW